MTMKRLYRSNENRIILGIFGGVGEYFNIDPVLLRLGYLLFTAFTGIVPGIVAYIVAGFIVPKKQREDSSSSHSPLDK